MFSPISQNHDRASLILPITTSTRCFQSVFFPVSHTLTHASGSVDSLFMILIGLADAERSGKGRKPMAYSKKAYIEVEDVQAIKNKGSNSST
ncbi:unnamed protein product [Lactuca virosa]|uniref:Uncharacterized protein n=1 Tax=Lactuca virosa TaxID=75947 RepID=A0AAU9PCH6_9ASTR|nr:unnamed protein product [Lactuca virosa]